MKESWNSHQNTVERVVASKNREDEKFEVGSNVTLSLEDPKALSQKLENSTSLQVTNDSSENLKRILVLEIGTKKATTLVEENKDVESSEEGSFSEKQMEIERYITSSENQSKEQLVKINTAKNKVERVYEKLSSKLGLLSEKYPDIITKGFTLDVHMRYLFIRNMLEKLAVVVLYKGESSIKFAMSLDLNTTPLSLLKIINNTQEEIRTGVHSKYVKVDRTVASLEEMAQRVLNMNENSKDNVQKIKREIGESAFGINRGNIEYNPSQEMLDYKDKIGEEIKNLEDGITQLRQLGTKDINLEYFKKFNTIMVGAEIYKDIYSRFNDPDEVRKLEDKIFRFRNLFIQKFPNLSS